MYLHVCSAQHNLSREQKDSVPENMPELKTRTITSFNRKSVLKTYPLIEWNILSYSSSERFNLKHRENSYRTHMKYSFLTTKVSLLLNRNTGHRKYVESML